MIQRLHVVLREPVSNFGGVHTYVRTLCSGQRALGLEPIVADRVDAAGNSPAWSPSLTPLSEGAAVHFHFAHSALPFLRNASNRESLARAVHVMHFHGPWAAEARAHGDAFPKVLSKWLYEMATYRRVRRFVVTSKSFKQLLMRNYLVNPQHISVVTPGVDTERFTVSDREVARASLGLTSFEPPVFVVVRRLERRMGIDLALKAFAELSRGTLLIAGVGPARADLEDLVSRLGVCHRVKLLGGVSPEALPQLYAAADVVVVPSRALEGFGLIVLEAYASGRPVIATDVGGLSEALGPFSERALVRSESVSALKDAMVGYLSGAAHETEPYRAYAQERSAQVMARQVEDTMAGWQ